jgi:DNA-binding beta-propeller fold protein YncE
MFGRLKVFVFTAALAASSFGASGAQAAGWIIGLVDGKSIVVIDPATRKVTSKADVRSAGPLLGIDVRPADGMLYGVAGDGTIVTIDPKSGQATMKSKMSQMLKPGVGAPSTSTRWRTGCE